MRTEIAVDFAAWTALSLSLDQNKVHTPQMNHQRGRPLEHFAMKMMESINKLNFENTSHLFLVEE